MALHTDFPRSPYDPLLPSVRWFPAAEELRSTAYERLLPPQHVAHIRESVEAWRNTNYAGASPTSCALLAWWFETGHLIEQADGIQTQFRYYFAQHGAVETAIWLYDVGGVRDKRHPSPYRRRHLCPGRQRLLFRRDLLPEDRYGCSIMYSQDTVR